MKRIKPNNPDVSPLLVYFSSMSENTHRFVKMVGCRSIRISRFIKDEPPVLDEPYVLICPSYGDNEGKDSVPKQVIRFLNISENRNFLQGVIGSGNRNFGEFFAHSGKIIARKCNVPLLYRFELAGTTTDVIKVREGLEKLWISQILQPAKKALAT